MILSNTPYGHISQLESEKKIEIHFLQTTIKMCVTDFLLQRGKINRVDVETRLNDLSDFADTFEFVVSKYNFKLHLSLLQFFRLKDLVNQAMFSLELQSILEASHIMMPTDDEVLATF